VSESELFFSDSDPAKTFGLFRIRIHNTDYGTGTFSVVIRYSGTRTLYATIHLITKDFNPGPAFCNNRVPVPVFVVVPLIHLQEVARLKISCFFFYKFVV
jgi:hypothetical protein